MTKLKTALEGVPKFFRYLLILGVVGFISLLFPNSVRFEYEYEKGQSWRYETLTAPFDFAINKPGQQLETELQQAMDDYHPYYERLPEVDNRSIQDFQGSFDQRLDDLSENEQFQDLRRRPNRYKRFGTNFLEQYYQVGIIKTLEAHQTADKPFLINLFNEADLSTVPLNRFYEVEEVKQALNDTLAKSSLEDTDFLLPLLQERIIPNIVYQDSISQSIQEEIAQGISPTQGMVRKGELIVNRGDNINDQVYQKLLSLEKQYENNMMANRSRLLIFIGYFLLTSLIIGVFVLYLINFASDIFNSTVKLIFIFMWLVLYSYLVTAVESTELLNAYLIPFCIVPIVIKTFYQERLALFTHIIVVLIASFLSSQGYEFTFLQILAGIVVLLTDVDTRDWTRFFTSIFFLFLTYSVGYFSLSLIQEGRLSDIDFSNYSWLLINVVLTLLAYPLIPLLERFFGFTSSISLMELSDMNRPLLRKLALDAPGTLQHSLQVANLSEAAAQEIGADALLVKVAALYHDIGKTKNPEYFIENQAGKNPHNDISHLDSAKIIIDHIPAGVEMAKKARLPKLLIQFIKTHHGTTRTEYFYRNYLKEHPNESIDEQLFCYPGPKPVSKEETILMLADSIEAACKSLKEPTEENLNELIDKIINGKIQHGQLEESTMTFEELVSVKGIFQKVMKSVHHVRIEYPEEDQKKAK
ncbi:MAG TPA: HDIG domain-containing protein [Saprospiraceae bacterium]|nr:HDIG domain-containing protein [Saprospiraceae bacterium]